MVREPAVLIDRQFVLPSDLEEARSLQLQLLAHRGRMAATIGRGVAHELRNVAQLVGMLRDAMQRGTAVTEPLIDAIALAEATLIRQIGTLERLPPLSRHVRPMAIADTVDRAVGLIRRRWRGAKMVFTVDVSRTLPAVLAIEADLDAVVWELLNNAREAAERRRHGSIDIRATLVGEMIEVVVTDDGPGIPDEVRDTLFEPFATHQPDEEHMGIGLAVAQRLIMENGGELMADFEVASGTCFVLRLPVYTRESTAPDLVVG